MDLTEIAKYLAAGELGIAELDPYAGFGDVADTMGQVAIRSAAGDDGDMWESAALAFGSGLFGGLMNNASRDYRDSRRGKFQDSFFGALSGNGERPEGISDRLYNRAVQAADRYRYDQALINDQAERQITRDVDKAGRIEEAKVQGQLRGYGAEGGEASILSPISKEKRAIAQEEREARRFDIDQAKEERAIIDDAYTKESKDAKDFFDRTKKYRLQSEGFESLIEAFKDKHAVSDYELVRRGAQSIEPGLAVRRDDQEGIENSTSTWGAFGAKVRKQLRSESGLSDDTREAILRMAARSISKASPAYDSVRNQFLARAKEYNLDPDRIVVFGPAKTPEEYFPGFNFGGGGSSLKPMPGESREQFKARMMRGK